MNPSQYCPWHRCQSRHLQLQILLLLPAPKSKAVPLGSVDSDMRIVLPVFCGDGVRPKVDTRVCLRNWVTSFALSKVSGQPRRCDGGTFVPVWIGSGIEQEVT